jgi:fructose-1,6-bisphosphatase I
MIENLIGTSFNNFINNQDKSVNDHDGLSCVLNQVIKATIEISQKVNQAGLLNILGKADKENVQGEEVMKLDEIANDTIIEKLSACSFTAGLASEELDTFTSFENKPSSTPYIVLFDPLDGSSNIDTNASIGTIFSIYKRCSKEHLDISDFTQPGTAVVAAGYVLYGSSTLLVYSAGNGVHGFTLEPKSSMFLLSHYDIKSPDTANQFSINYGNHKSFDKRTNSFVKWCTEEDKESNRPYSLRYIGSMVADFHRNLVKGGIFIYPATEKAPKGKLRLMYECIPLSYIQEQAGGKSSDNHQSILDIQPSELHQRTPVVIGSSYLVDKYLSC